MAHVEIVVSVAEIFCQFLGLQLRVVRQRLEVGILDLVVVSDLTHLDPML
jgi:hypothetical protein